MSILKRKNIFLLISFSFFLVFPFFVSGDIKGLHERVERVEEMLEEVVEFKSSYEISDPGERDRIGEMIGEIYAMIEGIKGRIDKLESKKTTDEEALGGVYITFNDAKETTKRFVGLERVPLVEKEIKEINIVNPVNENREMLYSYVVVLHGKEDFRGQCKPLVTNYLTDNYIGVDAFKETASISILPRKTHKEALGAEKPIAYNKTNLQDDAEKQMLEILDLHQKDFRLLDIDVWSIDIKEDYAIMLASGSHWDAMEDECALFVASEPITLYGHFMNRCDPEFISDFFASYNSCADYYMAFPLY